MTFHIVKGDTSPAIEYQLQDSDGNPVNITGFNEIRFHMRKKGVKAPKVDADTSGNVSATDAEKGKVKYDWEKGNTDEAGDFEAEWEVEYIDGTIETFPNRRKIDVDIEEEIS